MPFMWECFQTWVNVEIHGGVRLYGSGRGLVWISVAMPEPGPGFVIVLGGTLSLALLVSSFDVSN